MSISNILKGIGGEFELIRTMGAAGIAAYIVGANVFEAYVVFGTDRGFDLIAFCTAFPAGLGVAIGAVAGASAVKDRNVAVARQVQDTGVIPSTGAPAP